MAKNPLAAYPGHSLDPSLIEARATAYDQQAAQNASGSAGSPAPATPSSSNLDAIRSDPDFRKLPPASQVAVLAHFTGGAPSPSAAESGQGFGALSSAATPWSERCRGAA
jgi:hypothetical protein